MTKEFKIPRQVASLDEIENESLHQLYQPQEGGGFALAPDAAVLADQAEAAFERTVKEHEAAAEAERIDARNRTAAVAAVRDALTRAGVRQDLLAGATALFLQTHEIACRQRGDGGVDVVVVGKHGGADPASAAVQFVADDQAGAAFRDAGIQPQGDGFAAAIAKLRDRVH